MWGWRCGAGECLSIQHEERAEHHDVTEPGERSHDGEPPLFRENSPGDNRMHARGGGSAKDDRGVEIHVIPLVVENGAASHADAAPTMAYDERLRVNLERTPPAARPPSSSSMDAGSGTAVGSMRSVVRIPNVKPCQFSGVGTTHENVLNVPMN